MNITYAHTNIVCEDWKKLARFYTDVLQCTPVPPERSFSGDWLDKGVGIKDVEINGIHLRLPGYGENGPTLEIFQYKKMEEKPGTAANRKGFGHIAFRVDDVREVFDKIIRHGGSAAGEIVTKQIGDEGTITFIYAKDPEDNIIELQKWT
ncbi:MAG: VOC family protein [bacterium]|nr:VOC family protein [bacterium]